MPRPYALLPGTISHEMMPVPSPRFSSMTCEYCNEEIAADAKHCPRCLRKVGAGAESEVYELPSSTSADIPQEWQPGNPSAGAAVYTLEQPARCPFCREIIRTVRVVRLKRSQVAFTSPLPRGGRMIVCSACDGILSADLSTL